MDFVKIENGIGQIAMAANELSLWVSTTVTSGKMDESRLEAVRKSLGTGGE